jgi:hypothetical protein
MTRFTNSRWTSAVCLCIVMASCHSNKSSFPSKTSGSANQSEPAVSPDQSESTAAPTQNPIVTKAFSPEKMQGAVMGKPVDPHVLTETELRFGRAPKRTSDVTYQNDALIMENGDKALKSMSSDGLTWHFDAKAKDVGQIQEGKVIFATERCVGRVLGLQRNGDDVAVQLGPIQITDVVQKGHFAYDQPLDLNSMIAIPAPSLPWLSTKDGQQSFLPPDQGHIVSATYAVVSSDGVWHPFRSQHVNSRGHLVDTVFRTGTQPAMHAPASGWIYRSALQKAPLAGIAQQSVNSANTGSAPTPSIGDLPNVDITGLNVAPCISGCGGIGIKLGYDKNGIKVSAWVVFHLNNPSLHFHLDVDSSGIHTAAIELGGAAGFSYHFETGTDHEFNGNIHQLGILPVDLSIPVGGFGVPLSIHLIQSISLQTGFSARTSVLAENGDYTARGSIEVGYIDGTWGGGSPNMSTTKNIAEGVSGISMGINSLVFGIRQEVLVGIGMFGFATGPYVAVTTSFTALKQASEAMIDCRQATFIMSLSAGVGYSLPKPLVSVFNFFLRALHAKEMPSAGSILEMKPSQFVDMGRQSPDGCASEKKK